jgi:hypothetical protein
MAVFAVFKYEVKPGRMPDFLKKLHEAASPRFNGQGHAKTSNFFLARCLAPTPAICC